MKIAEIARSITACFVLVFLLALGAFGAWYVGEYAAHLATTDAVSSTLALTILMSLSLSVTLSLAIKVRMEKKVQKEWEQRVKSDTKRL